MGDFLSRKYDVSKEYKEARLVLTDTDGNVQTIHMDPDTIMAVFDPITAPMKIQGVVMNLFDDLQGTGLDSDDVKQFARRMLKEGKVHHEVLDSNTCCPFWVECRCSECPYTYLSYEECIKRMKAAVKAVIREEEHD